MTIPADPASADLFPAPPPPPFFPRPPLLLPPPPDDPAENVRIRDREEEGLSDNNQNIGLFNNLTIPTWMIQSWSINQGTKSIRHKLLVGTWASLEEKSFQMAQSCSFLVMTWRSSLLRPAAAAPHSASRTSGSTPWPPSGSCRKSRSVWSRGWTRSCPRWRWLTAYRRPRKFPAPRRGNEITTDHVRIT